MDKKYSFFVFMIIVILGVWLIYRESTTTTTTTTTTQEKIIIGRADWPGYVGLIVADKKGYFKEAGLDVEVRRYANLSDLSRDYIAGNIQGRANLTFDAINETYGGFDHKAIIVFDYSDGADGIIAGSVVHTVEDLKGKKVAVELGTLEEFLLRYALDQYGLSFSDIIPVNLNAESSAMAFVAKEVDAAVTYEPYMGGALEQSGGVKLFSSADAPGLIVDVLTMRSDFIARDPDALQALTRAYFRGVNFWKTSPDDANAIVADVLGSSPEDIARQLNDLAVLDERDNRTAFAFAPGIQSLYGNMRIINGFIRSTQPVGLHGPIDTDVMIDPRFIRNLFK